MIASERRTRAQSRMCTRAGHDGGAAATVCAGRECWRWYGGGLVGALCLVSFASLLSFQPRLCLVYPPPPFSSRSHSLFPSVRCPLSFFSLNRPLLFVSLSLSPVFSSLFLSPFSIFPPAPRIFLPSPVIRQSCTVFLYFRLSRSSPFNFFAVLL